jgi:RNA polymerase sigma-70 factor, ECF subfamily
MAIPWLDVWCVSGTTDDRDFDPPRLRRARRTSSNAPAEKKPYSRLVLADDIIPRLRTRDESAYRDLIQTASARLTVFAASIVRSRDVAEDVVQNVLVRIWNLGDKFDPPRGKLADYLFTAVRNEALTALRGDVRAARAVAVYHAPVQTPDEHESDATDQLEHTLAALRAAMDTLTEHQRAAVALRYGEGMPIAQIARIMAISDKGVEQLLVRIRKVIRARMVGARQTDAT